MSSIRVTVSMQQGTISESPAIRLEFDTQISATGAYTLRHKQYWRDDVFRLRPVSHALMMAQLLRRIEGVGEITVSQYALVIKIGQRFIATNPKRAAFMGKIKKAISSALETETPWATVWVPQNWSYHFGSALATNGAGCLHDVKPDSSDLTDFGRRAIAAFQDKGGFEVGTIWEHHFFIHPAAKGDRPEVHVRIDALLKKHLRSRTAAITWIGT